MISGIKNYFKNFYQPRSKEERDLRFPNLPFIVHPVSIRKTGLSMDQISPKYLYQLIIKYYESLDNSNHRYEWLRCWLPVIESELDDLNKYTMENVGRVVIIQNEKAIFDFYLIYDIHIQDVETVVVNLNNELQESSYVSNTILSLSMLFSAGSLGFFLSNLFI
jgi:hypothetical protein